MPVKIPSVTIIGFGAFGRLVARILAPHVAVSVFDRSATACACASALGYVVHEKVSTISADIIILAVPVGFLDECLRAIAPHLRAGQMVVDVCSIKEEPAQLMRQRLPEHVEILASHPMFGPQSAKTGTAGSQIVFCPLRGTGWRRLAAFLRLRLGFDIIVTSPEDHDRQAAMSQGLTHLLARAFATMGSRPRIRTRSFDLLSEALAMVANDAPEVFEAITTGNRHLIPLRNRLLSELTAFENLPAEANPAVAHHSAPGEV